MLSDQRGRGRDRASAGKQASSNTDKVKLAGPKLRGANAPTTLRTKKITPNFRAAESLNGDSKDGAEFMIVIVVIAARNHRPVFLY
jgi:hypothetical protein